MRAIFGWIGINDVEFINAQPMDYTLEIRQSAIELAIDNAKTMAADTDWSVGEDPEELNDLTGLKPQPLE